MIPTITELKIGINIILDVQGSLNTKITILLSRKFPITNPKIKSFPKLGILKMKIPPIINIKLNPKELIDSLRPIAVK
jgi:hypothetical protein